jgi:hypothetical protein
MSFPSTDELFEKVIVINELHYGLLSQFEDNPDLPDYRLFCYEEGDVLEFDREDLITRVEENGELLDTPQYLEYSINYAERVQEQLKKARKEKEAGNLSQARTHLNNAQTYREEAQTWMNEIDL